MVISKEFYDEGDVSLIIPCKEISQMTLDCINNCLSLSSKLEIIVVTEKKINTPKNKQLKILITNEGYISSKRNFGVANSKRKIISFIDDDVIPTKYWLKNAIKILNNQKYKILGGPNISPRNENFQESIVGDLYHSILVSGFSNFRKKISSSRETDFLPSCNFFILRKTYKGLKGMNENLYTGEDLDFCNTININKIKIFFSRNVIVFHKNRNFINYFKQRFIYGVGVKELLSEAILSKSSILISAPFFYVLFLFSFIFTIYWNFFFLFWLSVFSISILIFLIESILLSKSLYLWPLYFLLIFLSCVLPGFGTLLSPIITFNIRKNIYTNS